jgi:hypothetical protein
LGSDLRKNSYRFYYFDRVLLHALFFFFNKKIKHVGIFLHAFLHKNIKHSLKIYAIIKFSLHKKY